MAATRKRKTDDGGARLRLIQATVQLMHDEGTRQLLRGASPLAPV